MTKEEVAKIRAGDIITVRFAVTNDLSNGGYVGIAFAARIIPYKDILSVEKREFRIGDIVKGSGFTKGVLKAEFDSEVPGLRMAVVYLTSSGTYLTVSKSQIEFF